MMRKHLLNIPLLVTLACLVVSAASAQVIINEFSASNYTLGVNGDNEDYIEFYNEGPTEVDLDGRRPTSMIAGRREACERKSSS